jgi:hypothetical protein
MGALIATRGAAPAMVDEAVRFIRDVEAARYGAPSSAPSSAPSAPSSAPSSTELARGAPGLGVGERRRLADSATALIETMLLADGSGHA